MGKKARKGTAFFDRAFLLLCATEALSTLQTSFLFSSPSLSPPFLPQFNPRGILFSSFLNLKS